MNIRELNNLFMPGPEWLKKLQRTPNKLKRGYLKKSVLANMGRWFSVSRKQGEREMARRRSQIARGIIRVN